jgi:hypothetical protein
LYKADFTKLKIGASFKEIQRVLDKRESDWRAEQKEMIKRKIEKARENGKKVEEKHIALLRGCKQFGGPFLDKNEMESALKLHGKDEKIKKKIIKQEISYRKLSCPRDVLERPALYKLNKLSVMELEANLLALVSSDFDTSLPMPDEDEVIEKIKSIFLTN